MFGPPCRRIPRFGVQDEAHFPPFDSDMERVQRIMLATSRPEAVAEAEEVFLIDLIQHRRGRPLDHLVFKGRHTPSELHLDPTNLWDRLRSSIRSIRCADSGLSF